MRFLVETLLSPYLILTAVAILNAITALFTYLFAYKLSKQRYISAKYFSVICLGITSWSVWLILRYWYYTQNLGISIPFMGYFFGVMVYPSVVIIVQSLVWFALSFHNKKKNFSDYGFLWYPFWFIMFLIFLPKYGLFELTTDIDMGVRFRSLPYYIFTTYILVYIALYVVLLIQRFRLVQNRDKRIHIILILIGTGLTLVTSIIANLILPIIYQANEYFYIGPISTIFVIISVLAAMVFYRLFDIHWRISGLLTVLIITIFFFVIRFGIDGILGIDIRISLLRVGIFVLLYGFLIREAYQNTKNRITLNERKQELENALGAKNDFLRIASHQLRTPLTVVTGYLSMMTSPDKNNYSFNAEAMTDLKKAYVSSQNLNDIINDMLSANEVNTGKFGVSIKDLITVEDLMKSIIESKQNILVNHNTTVHFVSKGKAQKVTVDKNKLKEAINNIFDNSIYYGGGKVEVVVDNTSKGIIKLKIKDNGIGLTQDDLKVIWKKFERGKRSSAVNPNGSGLGLYLAKKILEEHQGDLIGESEGKDKGSLFTFIIPTSITSSL